MATIFYFDISVVHRFWRSDFYTGVFGIWCVIVLKDKSNNQSLLHPKVWVLPTVCYNLKVPFLIFCLLLRFLATILAKTSFMFRRFFCVKINLLFSIVTIIFSCIFSTFTSYHLSPFQSPFLHLIFMDLCIVV